MGKKIISTQGSKFIDQQGRHTILHGINMVCKDKNKNYIGDYKEEDFITLKNWGFNVIRLGIFWDGVEPEPGNYDDVYLSRIDQIITLAGKHGLYIFLDMHQDLFSCCYADGAPEWATLTEGQEHISTALWSESYLLSPAVQAAFDSFWNNRPTVDGIGIQDHYINMWKHIASRYHDHENVIGYDVLNEPFMGSEVNHLLPELLATMGKLIAEGQPVDLDLLMEKWLDPVRKMELMSLFSNKELYLKLVREVERIPQQFEQTYLQEFYTRIGRAIRKVDEDTILFLEANYFSNSGMMSSIQPILDINGVQIKYQAFSPHGYDLLVDTELYQQSSSERIDVIFETHKRVQEELQLPMLVGEWGCYPDATKEQLPQVRYLSNLFEKFLSGDTYYDFSHIYNNLITKAIIRAYPMKAAGEILSYNNDFEKGSFHCSIRENGSMENSILYIPELLPAADISVEPLEQGYRIERLGESDSGYLILPAAGQEMIRIILISQ